VSIDVHVPAAYQARHAQHLEHLERTAGRPCTRRNRSASETTRPELLSGRGLLAARPRRSAGGKRSRAQASIGWFSSIPDRDTPEVDGADAVQGGGVGEGVPVDS
jgi:hypothetical protein